jgi:hypothetical protein
MTHTGILDLGLGTPWPVVDGRLTHEGGFKPSKRADPVIEPEGTGYVYVVSLRGGVIPRAVGTSDVLYVGMTTKGGRVGQLTAAKHSASPALSRLHSALTGRRTKGIPARVALFDSTNPRLHECLALNAIVHSHGEMPPANSRWERWLVVRVLEHLAGAAVLEGWSESTVYDWPEDEPVLTAIDLHRTATRKDQSDGRTLRGSLVWIWHKDWLPERAEDEGKYAGELFLMWKDHPDQRAVPARVRKDWDGFGVRASHSAPGLYGAGDRREVKRLLDRLLKPPDKTTDCPGARLESILQPCPRKP